MNCRTSWNQSTWNKSDASLWLCNMGRNGHNGKWKRIFSIWWWNLTIWAMFIGVIQYVPYTCMLSPALYLYIYLSCLVNGNLCDSVCNIKNGPFHSMWSHCFMYLQIVAWNHVFSRVNIILCAFPYTFVSLSVHTFCLLKYYHLRAVDGQIIVDTDHPVGPPSLFLKKGYPIMLLVGIYRSCPI